ncbi:MAG: 16S rRNA (cytosine(1402)-N(4))-methyltransferase RsmH [Kiritimatiellae bacterium]|nr:16S rRNA (cytosine(1402)-N(4))-methyltransferase RsmH [Kiritimatiellia bacterium]
MMLEEAVAALAIRPGGIYLDGTAGSGGHTAAILERLAGTGCVVAMDRDDEAIRRCRKRLAEWSNVVLVNRNYSEMGAALRDLKISGVDGILLDLGVSSDQLAEPQRGFSFQQEGPLDMRMDRNSGLTAAELVNSLPEAELAALIWKWGEERQSRRIAAAIVAARPVKSTRQLAEIVERAKGGRRGRIHPATQTFQALRIAVNNEFEHLEQALEDGLGLLNPHGRMAVISFHSLEDRRVKRCFRAHAGRMESLQAGGADWIGERPRVVLVGRKFQTAGPEEMKMNPRARSARLRVVERTEDEQKKKA